MTELTTTPEEWLTDFAEKCHYEGPKILPGDRYALVSPMLFTAAIITGDIGDDYSFTDRWCYHSTEAAHAALEAWDGEGEPKGWHRHPASGRRISVTGTEIDKDGNKVSGIGVEYVYL
jgi:hypothetical protein